MKRLNGSSESGHATRTLPCAVLSLVFAAITTAAAQAPRSGGDAPPPATSYLIHAARLIDGKSDQPRSNVTILVTGDRIVAVGGDEISARAPAGAVRVDLGSATVLPGLTDTH